MTNGPEARVGAIVTIDLPRPRVREELLEDVSFYEYRGRLLQYLEMMPLPATPEPVALHETLV
jgi:nitrate/nitrite transport system ATP-binding protein